MKTCYGCERSLDLSAFSRDRSRDDGLSYKCRECLVAYRIAKGLQKPVGWERKTADMVAYQRMWKAARPGYMAQKKAEWVKAHPERRRVQDRYKYALKTGKLVRWPCEVCGDVESEGHHPDYSRPLTVVWLCRKHHKEVHS